MRTMRNSIILLLLSTVFLLPLPAFAEGEEQISDEGADAIVLAADASEEQADALDEAIDAVPAEAPEPVSAVEAGAPLLGDPEEPAHEDGWENTEVGTF